MYSIKPGRVVVVLRGRYAGRKAVVVQTHEAGSGDRKFGHVVGTFCECAAVPLMRNRARLRL
jgi:ribosomal protein L14E/L6E/L27E